MAGRLSALTGAAPGWLRRHWPILPVLAAAAFLLFTNLDQEYLWADEGDTAVLAQNILEFGVPAAWDGTALIDPDLGARLDDDLVMVSHPWLQYYVTAASFAVFGESALAARLPFAVFGLLTIALVYAMLVAVARNRWAAVSAVVLLTVSVQFLIFARQNRYYSLTALLTCLLVLQFTRLRSWRHAMAWALTAALLFHSHPIGLAPVLALTVVALVDRTFGDVRPWALRALPLVGILTVPWLLLAREGYSENTVPLQGLGLFLPRLGQFAIECASVTSILGTALLFLTVKRRVRPTSAPGRLRLLTPDEHRLAVPLLATLIALAVAMALAESRDMIWMTGVRYTTAVLPFCAMLAGLAIAKASHGRVLVAVTLVVVFGFTKLGRLAPWTFWEDPTPIRDEEALVTFHSPVRTVDRFLRTSQVDYVRDLYEPNPGTTARVAGFLNTNASPDDIIVTNYAWSPIYFHTGLPQGLKVLPSYPIWNAAQALDLPEYVFSMQGARWIVWRRAWGRYRDLALGKVIDGLRSRGARITLAASIKETVWENRANVHFRRFPSGRYHYGFFKNPPSTLIYRVGQ